MHTLFKRLVIATALLATASQAAAQSTAAQDSPWLVRLRAVHLNPADKSDPVGGTGAADRITARRGA